METLEYIEAYFQQQLTAEEKKLFEQKCESDNAFEQDVAFYVTARQALREELLEQKQSQWREEDVSEEVIPSIAPSKTSFIRKWLPYAAAACVLLAISVIFFEKVNSPQQIASSYIRQNYSQISQTMDGSKDSLQQGIALYNNQKYSDALPLFKRVAAAHPENSDAKKYAGLVYLQTKNYDEALKEFDALAAMKLFSNPGKFLKAGALMERNKAGDKKEAKQMLQQVVNEKLEGNEKAEEWLKKF